MPCSLCGQPDHTRKKCSINKIINDLKTQPILEEPVVVDSVDIAMIRSISTEILESLGSGHTESVYHNAMKIALQDNGIKFESERDIIIKSFFFSEIFSRSKKSNASISLLILFKKTS